MFVGGRILDFKRKTKYAVIIIIFLVLSYYGYNYYIEDLDDPEPKLMALSDKQPSTTIIAPTLDTKIEKGKNIVYCSTFQMAWNQLYRDVIKDTIEINDAPDYVSKLNLLINSPAGVSEDAYIAVAGIVKDNVIDKTHKLLKEKFAVNLFDLIGHLNFSSNDIFAFSYLYKNLPFEEVFEKINGHSFEFGGRKSIVKAFGINEDNERLREMVRVLYVDYKNHDQFVISLKTKSSTDEVVISTLPPEETLGKTYLKIRKYFEKNYTDDFTSRVLGRKLILVIPKVDFNVKYYYNKLENKSILNKNFKEYFINMAIQSVRFKMNEKGVVLTSYSFIMAAKGESFPLIVNGPFFIYLRDKNSDFPYFMAYIANDELLLKSN